MFALRTSERVATSLLFFCATISILTTIGIVAVLVGDSAAFFQSVSFRQFFFDTQWTPLFAEKHFGIWPLMAGTLLTTAIAISVAAPIGLLAAIYLAEFARPNTRRILKASLEMLAGVPTVVFGFFALTIVTPFFQRFIPGLAGFNALSAGVMIGIMIVPVIASLSEDALSAVPSTLREAALSLGGDKLAAIFRVTVPSAFSGIGAALILGLSRAIGETMIVAIAAGLQPRLTLDPRVPIETMTSYIVQVSLGDTPRGTLEYRTIFVVGLSLFVMTLIANIASYRLRRRILKAGAW